MVLFPVRRLVTAVHVVCAAVPSFHALPGAARAASPYNGSSAPVLHKYVASVTPRARQQAKRPRPPRKTEARIHRPNQAPKRAQDPLGLAAAVSPEPSTASPPSAMLQGLRTAQFLALGYTGFTQRGYRARARGFRAADLHVDLTARTFLVTGANSGLGRAVAVELARRGGNVHMLCRDPTRGEAALRDVAGVAPDPNRVRLWICDLESIRDVQRFANEWYAQIDSTPVQRANDSDPSSAASRPVTALDCLVNNAGMMVHKRADSPDGLERNFAVNVMGTYVLTELLVPALRLSEHPRVVTVSSGGMLLAGREALCPGTMLGEDLVSSPSSPDEPEKIDGQAQYARNKRCQVALTEHWAYKYSNTNIHWSVMHPGWTSTPGLARSMPEFHSQFKQSLRTEAEGADTICWLAISDAALRHQQAAFFLDRSEVPKHMWLAGTAYSPGDVQAFGDELKRIALERAKLAL